ncbi:S-adenosyl-L-methionine-dependent methyltransferase [Phascolomyces articulosus]|uniref:peptide chain release factor N(5)-glutamine methyltransferase n=1 Tax=Phascolomyces articulosus TaxID=60185 RepID=A0AAD5K2M9_9FUNG|nr:S-adenosyl-L-methionine-dependent methyltransferase [Phascolomyces articulosus]
MPRRLWRYQDARWIRQLLPAYDNDMSLAKRQLTWLKEKTQNPKILDHHVRDRAFRHKPLQYILGTQPFGELDIVTRPPTLIPRWETEEWVHRLIDILLPHLLLLKKNNKKTAPFRILDLCTGSGCIGLSLATQLPSCHIVAIDISKEAILLAQENYKINHAQVLQQNSMIEFKQLDIFAQNAMETMMLRDQSPFDLIVSNPPYVTMDEYQSLDPDVKEWEDPRALVANEQGMAIHQRIIELANNGLLLRSSQQEEEDRKIPRLVMEFGGTHQVKPLKQMIMKDKILFKDVQVWKDLADKDRVVIAM